jgi:hypothetical protein
LIEKAVIAQDLMGRKGKVLFIWADEALGCQMMMLGRLLDFVKEVLYIENFPIAWQKLNSVLSTGE